MATDNGTVTQESRHSVAETLNRLETALSGRGFIISCRIDHSAAAATIGEALLPRTVLVYGNPRVGTAAMAKFPTLAIDLPPKLLVWQDAAGKVWVTHNTADYFFGTLFPRHGAAAEPAQIRAAEAMLHDLIATAVA